MLKEIKCDKFISNGDVRNPIYFHSGLNTVLGSESGTNSIGKSTFLMIIDFAFGGNDYIDKCDDVLTNVGPHTIQFCFEFDGQQYYFSRSSHHKNEVNRCDSAYNKLETITLDKYKKFLHKKYQIGSKEQTFRGAIGNYFRIYLRECCDEGHPLKASGHAPDKDGITELIKLFNKYGAISSFSKELKETKEREFTYKKAITFSQISSPKNKNEYIANEKEIEKLNKEIEKLIEKSNDGLLEMDSIVAKRVAEIKSMLSKLRRKHTHIKSQMTLLIEESNSKKQMENDFSELLSFFPNANIKAIKDVEGFHAGLMEALALEYREKERELEDLLMMTEKEINQQEDKLKEISCTPDVSRAVLDNYADAMQRYNNLKEANEHYDECTKLKQKVKGIEKQVAEMIKSELFDIASNVNAIMDEYNKAIYLEERSSPTIDLKSESQYVFDTPNDRGTGSRYKGLILFDLAVLKLTKLPAVAHDSFMLKQIEDTVLEKLLEIYTNTEKQIFIAMDKEKSYTLRAQELLRNSVVLRLSAKGNELFGRSWNKKNNEVD